MRRARSLLCLVVVAAWSAEGRAGMLPVFGPSVFERSAGEPAASVAAFASCEPAAQWRLVATSDARVNSAEIVLNGQRVLAPSDFHPSVTRIERPILLARDNRIAVRIAGDPGARLTVSVECTANCLEVQIASPSPLAAIDRAQTLVFGSLSSSSDEAGVKVNDVTAQVQGGRFAALAVPLALGSNSIVVTATNACLNRATATTTVATARFDPPPIVLSAIPLRGVAPRTVTLRAEVAVAAQTYQWDFDGDGSVDVAGSGLSTVQHSFMQSGVFFPRLTVIDSTGTQYSEITAISLSSESEIATLLQARWSGFAGALSSGDLPVALGFLDGALSQRMSGVFSLLAADLPAIASELGVLTLGSIRGDIAEFSTVRLQDGQNFVYFIYFAPNVDGLWKIISM